MVWKNDKYRHSVSRRGIKTVARGKFLQNEYYPTYESNDNYFEMFDAEELNSIYDSVMKNDTVKIIFPNKNGVLFISNFDKKLRFIYKENISTINEKIFDNRESINNIFANYILYGESQKRKGYTDNIYRSYTINGNDFEIEWSFDTVEILDRNSFKQMLLLIDKITLGEILKAKSFIDNQTKEKWL